MSFQEHAPYWLCPPGEGVYTVSSGSDKRLALQTKLYGKKDPRTAWLAALKDPSALCLLGVPSDCGGGIQRGANWGPLYVREAAWQDGPLGLTDLGDVRVVPQLLHDKYLNQETLEACRKALYGQADKAWPVSPLSITEAILKDLYRDRPQTRVLAIGGDHSVSYPLVKAWAEAPIRQNKKLALLHFDAHTDLLEERLGIDLCFGSWTYHVRPYFPTSDQLIQVGIRATGKEKSHWEKLGLTQYWAKDVNKRGMLAITQDILKQYQRAGVEEVYVSFDIDALDARWASATGTPEEGGLDPIACTQLFQAIAEAFPVTGADLVEVAPLVNPDMRSPINQRLTLETAGPLLRQLALILHA